MTGSNLEKIDSPEKLISEFLKESVGIYVKAKNDGIDLGDSNEQVLEDVEKNLSNRVNAFLMDAVTQKSPDSQISRNQLEMNNAAQMLLKNIPSYVKKMDKELTASVDKALLDPKNADLSRQEVMGKVAESSIFSKIANQREFNQEDLSKIAIDNTKASIETPQEFMDQFLKESVRYYRTYKTEWQSHSDDELKKGIEENLTILLDEMVEKLPNKEDPEIQEFRDSIKENLLQHIDKIDKKVKTQVLKKEEEILNEKQEKLSKGGEKLVVNDFLKEAIGKMATKEVLKDNSFEDIGRSNKLGKNDWGKAAKTFAKSDTPIKDYIKSVKEKFRSIVKNIQTKVKKIIENYTSPSKSEAVAVDKAAVVDKVVVGVNEEEKTTSKASDLSKNIRQSLDGHKETKTTAIPISEEKIRSQSNEKKSGISI